MNPILINKENAEDEIKEVIRRIHKEGAISGIDLELISYVKYQFPNILEKYEHQLMYVLGLFFKTSKPEGVLSFTYRAYADYIDENIGKGLSPVQASIKKSITENNIFSFSAPTSAGKSHLFRDLILSEDGDIVFVVPSRSLLNEYYLRINEIVKDFDEILVLQFIDNVNRSKTKRRVFVVTPERASELFRFPPEEFNIKLFLYDEAQLSEDGKRGIYFDAFVRRVIKKYPSAKVVFAHPFIENPSAQLKKHSFEGRAQNYKHQTVGKIFIEKKKDRISYFSPYIDKCHHQKNKKERTDDPVKEIISKGNSILIYISKSKIYKKAFLNEFSEYISMLSDITDSNALKIIAEVESLLAAEGKHSLMVELMKKGVLIHHGSIPLQVRYLLEQFANAGFAKICFSTSTLLQGVNMPFLAVWLNGARFSGRQDEKELALKNLIGRAGRTTKDVNKFDYGIVIVNDAKGFSKKFNTVTMIKEKSLLDLVDENKESKEIDDEFRLSLKEDKFDDSFDLPIDRVERLQTNEVEATIQFVLNELFPNGKIITQSEYRDISQSKRKSFKDAFKYVFESSLLRKLNASEQKILSTSISILLWQIQGRSFKEILKMRYDFVTKLKERNALKEALKKSEINQSEYDKRLDKIFCEISPEPKEIPDTSLVDKVPFSFMYMKVVNFDYDLLVYDTYDYLDKVIGYSLSKVYYAAFYSYFTKTSDGRALMLAKYFKYGTSDDVDVWLIRYGFSFEDIEWLREHVDYVTKEQIFFLPSVKKLKDEQELILKKFL